MITKPTVFILGAGASAPYGFPLGNNLFWSVINNALEGAGGNVLTQMDYSKEEIGRFRKDLLGSGRLSVDAFLEHRQELIPIGKAAMAYILIAQEREDVLYGEGEGTWYKYLYDKLSTSFEEFGNNTISVITYNYDRSLEHFLFNSLRKSYNKPEYRCVEQLRKIPIIHLHGRLGHLPWQDEQGSGRAYHPHTEAGIIEQYAEEIRIIHEDINLDSDPEFVEARELLRNAEQVYFLGFGYDATNLRRLRVDEWVSTPIIRGSTYGLVRNEHKGIHRAFNGKIELDNISYDVFDFLKNHVEWD